MPGRSNPISPANRLATRAAQEATLTAALPPPQGGPPASVPVVVVPPPLDRNPAAVYLAARSTVARRGLQRSLDRAAERPAREERAFSSWPGTPTITYLTTDTRDTQLHPASRPAGR